MKTPKLTPWFPPGTTPARVGVYETPESDGIPTYQYYNHQFWGLMSSTPESAYRFRGFASNYQNRSWRGLAVKP